MALPTLQKEPLTSPPGDSWGDSSPEISPDGRTLAFVRGGVGWGNRDVWVLPLGRGEARQITFGRHGECCDLAWVPGRDEIVFATGNEWLSGRVFRTRVENGTAEPVAGVGDEVAYATVRGDRLVYSRRTSTTAQQILRMPGRKARPADRVPRPLMTSSQNDYEPTYSPDGRKIAFSSDRSGSPNIWVSDAEGTRPVQLTAFEAHCGSPRFSPDRRRIAFDSLQSGNWDVYVVDAEGGRPRRLTEDPTADNVPFFAHDGRSLYFSSRRSGRPVLRFRVGSSLNPDRAGGTLPSLRAGGVSGRGMDRPKPRPASAVGAHARRQLPLTAASPRG